MLLLLLGMSISVRLFFLIWGVLLDTVLSFFMSADLSTLDLSIIIFAFFILGRTVAESGNLTVFLVLIGLVRDASID